MSVGVAGHQTERGEAYISNTQPLHLGEVLEGVLVRALHAVELLAVEVPRGGVQRRVLDIVPAVRLSQGKAQLLLFRKKQSAKAYSAF